MIKEYYDLADTLSEIEQYLNHVNNLCNEKIFNTIESLRYKIEELVECNLTLSDYLNKLNSIKLNVTESNNKNFSLNDRLINIENFYKNTSSR